MQGEIGVVEIDGGTLPPKIPLCVHKGVFDLQRREVAVVQPRCRSGHIHPEGHRGMQPALPVERLADAVIEVVPALAGEVRNLTQQPEGQSSLEVQPVEAGHVCLEADGTPAGFHGMGPKGAEFVASGCFQALWHNGHGG